MKANEIEVGKSYLVKVSGRVVPVKVLGVHEHIDHNGRASKRWRCMNMATRREITVRSAQRFRAAASRPDAKRCQVDGCTRPAEFIALHDGRRIADTEVCAQCQPAALARLGAGMPGWQHTPLCRHRFDRGERTGRAGKIEGTEIVLKTCGRCGATREAMMDFDLLGGTFAAPARPEA